MLVPDAGTATARTALLAGGLLGMGLADWIWGGSDDGDDETVDPFGAGGDGGDAGGMDDLGDMGDMGDLADLGDEGGADDGLGGGDDSEMEARFRELENELEGLSGTVDVVRGENEDVVESVDDVEENVRKLLEVYELVTRGANPFVDEAPPANAGFDDGGLGLYASREDELDEREQADAEAEDPVDVDDAVEGFKDRLEENGDDATSFDDLKSAYESDEIDWSDGDTEDAAETDESPADEEIGAETEAAADDASAPVESAAEATTATASPDGGESVAGEAAVADESTGAAGDDKPFLDELPAGYHVDLVVMEWLEYLVASSDAVGALQAIQHYEDLGWISEAVGTSLRTALAGLDHDELGAAPGTSPLSIDHHTQSLEYISRLQGNATDQHTIHRWLGDRRGG